MTTERHFLRRADGHLARNAAGHLVAVPCFCCPRIIDQVSVTVTGILPCAGCWQGFSAKFRWTGAPTNPNGVYVLDFQNSGQTPCLWKTTIVAAGERSLWLGDTCDGPPDSVLTVTSYTYWLWLYSPSFWRFGIQVNTGPWDCIFAEEDVAIPTPCTDGAFVNAVMCDGSYTPSWMTSGNHPFCGFYGGAASIAPV